jgi:hypothetical protein
MRCFACQTVVPREAQEANFCVACGRPLSQFCPYEVEADGRPLADAMRQPLCDEEGRAVASCNGCGGLYKSCARCHRLHELSRVVCRTPGCGGALREPIEPFASTYGPLDGTRSVVWNGGFGRSTLVGQPQDVEALQALAFRYGLLIGVSSRNLICWDWDGTGWHRRGLAPLVSSGELRIGSLVVEQGLACIVAEDRALSFSLTNGISREDERPGRFTHQTLGPSGWLLAGDQDLTRIDRATGVAREIPMPPRAGAVQDVAETADRIYLATSGGMVLTLDTVSGEMSEPFSRSRHRWARIAASEGTPIVLGYDEADAAGRLTLLTLDAVGQTLVSQRTLEAGTLGDLAWAGRKLYLARRTMQGESLIETYEVGQLTQSPTSVSLPAGMQTLPGLLALRRGGDDAPPTCRLILRWADGTSLQFQLVNPESGRLTNIGPYLSVAGPPLLCAADTRLVIAAREGQGTRLRTYLLEEPQS